MEPVAPLPDLKAAEQDLVESAQKLQQSIANGRELVKAVRVARKTAVKIDRFTNEMERAFRRPSHG